jgi:hypothetical protein
MTSEENKSTKLLQFLLLGIFANVDPKLVMIHISNMVTGSYTISVTAPMCYGCSIEHRFSEFALFYPLSVHLQIIYLFYQKR